MKLNQTFERKKHIRYFLHSLHGLPSVYSSLDTNRLTLVHFAVHALDLMGIFDHKKNNNDNLEESDEEMDLMRLDKKTIIDWIYSLLAKDGSGFKGGTYLGPFIQKNTNHLYDHSHVAMTYTALCTLLALGDDLSKIQQFQIKQSIIQNLRSLQRGNFHANFHPSLNYDSATSGQDYTEGAFHCLNPSQMGSEHDMRFLYCACSISYMLNDWSGIDKDKALQYIQRCHTYDGAFALIPGQEGHGGSTFCAVASLVLMDELSLLDQCASSATKQSIELDLPTWRDQLISWCVNRQTVDYDHYPSQADAACTAASTAASTGGMQGRPNKSQDTCYSYWIGGTLQILNSLHLIDSTQLTNYVLQNQTPLGGFSKTIGSMPDLLHSFYSIAWLALHNHHQIEVSQKNENASKKENHTATQKKNEHDSRTSKKCHIQSEESAFSLGDDDKKCDDKPLCTYFLHELDCVLGIRKSRAKQMKL